MIRPYKHIQSDFYRIHSFVNHLFLDIVFRAPKIPQAVFTSDLVLHKYKPLIDNVNAVYILNPITECYRICKALGREDLKKLKRGVHVNNKIRSLCNGELAPIEYSDIDKISHSLSTQLKIFFDKLYDNSIGISAFYSNYGKIDEYYKKLIGKSRTCRCCGINKVLTKFHSKRSALDHYLPRNHFPFISINCNNLLPICDTCNSKYKLGENTIFEELKKGKKLISRSRKKAFYPYSKISPYPNIEVKISLKIGYSESIEPKDLDISLECLGYEEQVASWDRLFGIKENYLAECCTEEMYTYYEEQYIADLSFGKSHDEYVTSLMRNKYGDMNFLKAAFLVALK